MTYALLNILFLCAGAAALLFTRRRLHMRALGITTLIMLLLTAVFDPVIIRLGLVAYDASTLLGVYWINAPIEDFAYALLAPTLVAILWHGLERKKK